MTHLFLFAHPDDESVAAGGTIRRLADNGDQVVVIFATDGAAGEVTKKIGKKNTSKSKLRRKELTSACKILGVTEFEILGFNDGEINNKIVWGLLKKDFVKMIEKYRPQFLFTFDHSGWSYHLDHIGVSLATAWAVKEASHQADAFFFSLFRSPHMTRKWPYVFSKKLPSTHVVDITSQREAKIAALRAHASQPLEKVVGGLTKGEMDKEFYQLVFFTSRGQKLLKSSLIFQPITGGFRW